MKTKTLIELAALSVSLYTISKETHLLEKLKEMSAQGRDKIDDFIAEKVLDEHGNEIPFSERVLLKAKEARDEMEKRIGDMVEALYDKMNLTHAGKLSDLQSKLDEMTKNLALAEARIADLEKTGGKDGAV